jgi:hypothetical protein
MKIVSDVYLKAVIPGFRPGEPAKINRVIMAHPEGRNPRPCFELEYKDGVKDYVTMSDFQAGHYVVTAL